MNSSILEVPHTSEILLDTASESEPSINIAKDNNDQDHVKPLFISGTNIIATFACFPKEPEELIYSLKGTHCVLQWRKTVKNKFKKGFSASSINGEEKPTQSILNLREMCNLRKQNF